MNGVLEKFKNIWETYNGFALIAIIFGVLCLFFPWFQRSVYEWEEFSHYEYIYLYYLFFWDLKTTLFGLLFFLGFIMLIFYSSGIILSNHGNFGTPMEKHSKLFFKLSVIILIIYEILLYFHFINPPYSSTGWFSFFWDAVRKSGWGIYTGFILEIIMTALVLISYLYDYMMLRHHYREHLPNHLPKKDEELEFDI